MDRGAALQTMVVTGSLKIVLKEFFLRAGFLWNSNPLLSDAIKRWGEKQWRVDREMEVKRQREERMRSKESGQGLHMETKR